MGGVLSDLRARMACYKVGSGFRVHVLLTLAHKHAAVKGCIPTTLSYDLDATSIS